MQRGAGLDVCRSSYGVADLSRMAAAQTKAAGSDLDGAVAVDVVAVRTQRDHALFWQQTLAPGDPEPGRPKLARPGGKDDKTTKSMRGGLEPLAKALNNLATGLNLTVRNVTTHTRDELAEQEAMERLAAYSFLAGLHDQCEIRAVYE